MLDDDNVRFRTRLKKLGLTDSLIDAAWPTWWSEDADASVSARAELRYSLARKLGLDPQSLLDDGETPRFVWKDTAQFKNLADISEVERWILTSFGTALGNLLLSFGGNATSLEGMSPMSLRSAILDGQKWIRLVDLLSLCWSVGVPTVHLRVFPWQRKRMNAMSVRLERGSAILLGKDSQYPAQISFYLAHEIAHIALGHLEKGRAIVDFDGEPNPDPRYRPDRQEVTADRFALSLLTGTSDPIVLPKGVGRGARSLASAALNAAEELRIEPGTLALCFGHSTREWGTAIKALSYIYTEPKPVWREINRIASRELSRFDIPSDTATYLQRVMGEDAK